MSSNNSQFLQKPEKAQIIKAVDVSLLKNESDILEKAQLRAKKIEEDAVIKAKKILSDAEEQSALIIQEAKAAGEEHAARIDQEATAQANKQAGDKMIEVFSKLHEELDRLDLHVISLVDLALKKIIGELDEVEKIERVISRGLLDLREQNSIIISVHAAQFEAAQKAVARFHSQLKNGQKPIGRVEVDEKLHPGECLISSSNSVLDISIETQIDQIIRGLQDSRHGVSTK